MIAVIDYGAGNLKSVTNAVMLFGGEVLITLIRLRWPLPKQSSCRVWARPTTPRVR